MKRFWHGLGKSTNALGFGCWQIAGNHTVDGRPHGWGDISEKNAVRLLEHAIRSGIDFFDTAQSYNNGRSEELLGRAVSNTKSDPVICTKIVLSEPEIHEARLREDFAERLNASLRRLKRERVEVLLIHNPPDDIDWHSFDLTLLKNLQRQGKVGIYGVSSRGLKGAKNFVNARTGTVLEWTFNLFERRPAETLFPAMAEEKINFIARSPLSRGLINPKYLHTPAQFASDDFRASLPGGWVEWTLDSLRKFHTNGVLEEEIVKEALKFCVSHRQVTACIVGIKSSEQLHAILEMNRSANSQSNFNEALLSDIPVCFPEWA